MKKKEILVLIMSLFTFFGVLAQPQGGQMGMPSNGLITGKVVDDGGMPVEYAAISLVSIRDSSIVSGAITDNQGSFKLTDLKLGVYCLRIKVLGFETKEIKPVYLMPKGRGKGEGTEQDFGNIAMGNSDIKIDDVTIVGEKSHVQYKIDKKVVNASSDINSASGSAVDILQNTPSVNVDIDGNVSLRGSGNFTVLIDGKPTVLTGSEALQQIPANLVENIEIITNPSAKYDPDGAAGILNVVLKKKKNLGVTGLINLSAGMNDKYKGNVSLNYRTGKLSINASVDYRDEKRYGSGQQDREIYGLDTTYFMSYSGERDMHISGLGFQGGIDYFINTKNTISISGQYSDRNFGHISDSYYHEWTNPGSIDDYYLRHNEMGFGGTSYNLNLDYGLKFKKPDQKLDVSFSYSNRDGVRKNDQFKYITNSDNIITDVNPELRKADETGPEDNYRYKVDFVSPVGEAGVFEAGYQGRYEKEDQDYLYSNFNPLTSTWELDVLLSNKVSFIDNIQAIYSTFGNKIWGFDYKFGLRVEYNKRTLDQITTNEYFEFNKIDYFPSAYITRQISKSQQIQLNYSRRIDRPGGRQLDPFPDYSDPQNIRAGNPELEPEYIDSYELNFQQQFSKSFVSIETYYRRTNNLITNVSYLLEDNVLYRTYENMNHDNAIGIEFNANLFLNKWWRLNASGSGFYYQILGQISGEDISTESFNWNLRFDNSFSFKSNTKVQITGFYNAPSVTVQGKTEGFFFSNLAVRQDLMKGNLTITAQLQDIFGSMGRHFSETTDTYSTVTNFSREARVVTLALTYRLNNYKQKRNGEGREDMEMDMDMGI